MIRTLWVYAVGIWYTLVGGVHMILATTFSFRNARCTCDRRPRQWATRILKAARCPVTVRGSEHVDPDAPQIVISNHESWFDVFVLTAHLPGRLRFVAKKELERIPVFGKAFVACGHVTVDRGDRGSAIDSLDRAARQIRSDNSSIVVFPEGTRSPTGDLRRFKKGAFVLAIQAGVPIVPAAVVGTRAVMAKGSWVVRPGPIEIRIGRPIPVDELTHEDRDALLKLAYTQVAALRGGTGPVTLGPGAGSPRPPSAGGDTDSETDSEGAEATTNGPATSGRSSRAHHRRKNPADGVSTAANGGSNGRSP